MLSSAVKDLGWMLKRVFGHGVMARKKLANASQFPE